jgi:hypothetical protein
MGKLTPDLSTGASTLWLFVGKLNNSKSKLENAVAESAV